MRRLEKAINRLNYLTARNSLSPQKHEVKLFSKIIAEVKLMQLDKSPKITQ